MNHNKYIADGNAATLEQIARVSNQSDAYRDLDARIRRAAGWREAWASDNKTETPCWLHREPLPLRIRIRSTGVELLTGYEHARERILSGVAELVE
jgi:hypothetical protein